MHTQAQLDFEKAHRIIEHTRANLFLTGKAGTGKTTFLRKLAAETSKNFVVLAPTGIAAVNARGVTIHSFFQFPFAPFLPGVVNAEENFKLSKRKLRLIRYLDLIVIDEISMVRADLLDRIDFTLRRLRDASKPFGGVQLLLIGDLQQLAPVVTDAELPLIQKAYDSPFFFSSKALQQSGFLTIELSHVFRQSDAHFLDLLNAVRTNTLTARQLDQLNTRYIPHFNPPDEEGYIRLVTHNRQAQTLNNERLHALPGRAFEYVAEIKGNFPESNAPTDHTLVLKEGAQVMFIRNDANQRYFNGSIGRVVRIDGESFTVRLTEGEGEDIEVAREEWENTQYVLNEKENKIEEHVEGTFVQFPIKTAWAITIHKSQGLTFSHAIIDAAQAFSHGQTYVALSRCRTLEGLVLSRQIKPEAVITDEAVSRFETSVTASPLTSEAIASFEQRYRFELIQELFDFQPAARAFNEFLLYLGAHFKDYPSTLQDLRLQQNAFIEKVEKVSKSFAAQYTRLLQSPTDEHLLQERLTKGAAYFFSELSPLLHTLDTLNMPTDNQSVAKQAKQHYDHLVELLKPQHFLLQFVSKNGFQLSTFLHQRTLILAGNSEEKEKSKGDEPTRRKSQKRKLAPIPNDILHPKLYAKLVAWRNAKIALEEKPAYIILNQKALMGIANLLPTSKHALSTISGMGEKRIEAYGDELLAIVAAYKKQENQ